MDRPDQIGGNRIEQQPVVHRSGDLIQLHDARIDGQGIEVGMAWLPTRARQKRATAPTDADRQAWRITPLAPRHASAVCADGKISWHSHSRNDLHSLRRRFVTKARQAGIDLAALATVVGQ